MRAGGSEEQDGQEQGATGPWQTMASNPKGFEVRMDAVIHLVWKLPSPVRKGATLLGMMEVVGVGMPAR